MSRKYIGTYQEYQFYLNHFQNGIHALTADCDGSKERIDALQENCNERLSRSHLWLEIPKVLSYGTQAAQLAKEVFQLHSLLEVSETYSNEIQKDREYLANLDTSIQNLSILHNAVQNPGNHLDSGNEVQSVETVPVSSDGLTTEISHLFTLYDLRTGLKKVSEAWREVKSQRKSMYSALMVTYLAMNEILNLNELISSTCSSAREFFLRLCVDAVFKSSCPHLQQLYEVFLTLEELQNSNSKGQLFSCGHINSFHEESSTDNLNNNIRNIVTSEYRKLFHYYNLRQENHSGNYQDFPLIEIFLKQVDKLFETEILSISTVFTMTCVIEIVLVLSDSNTMFMEKTQYLSSQILFRDHHHHQSDFFPSAEFQNYFLPEYEKEWERILENRKESLPFSQILLNKFELLQNNIYLSTAVAFSTRLFDLENMLEPTWHDWCYYRAICHLYHAFKNEQVFTKEIPALEVFFNVFQKNFFPDELPDQGNYAKGYLSSVTTEKITNEQKKIQRIRQFPSCILQVLKDNGYYKHLLAKETVTEDTDISFSTMLDQISSISESEIFGTRCLSLDLFHYLQNFSRICEMFIHQPPFLSHYQQIMKVYPQLTRAQAIEQSFVSFILQTLDTPLSTRTIELHEMITKVAVFMQSLIEIEKGESFLVFPSSSMGIYEKQFGPILLKEKYFSQNAINAKQLFEYCVNEFELFQPEDSNQDHLDDEESFQLSSKEKLFHQRMKDCIKSCPSVVLFQSTNPSHRFPSLLDYAFHHPFLADRDFATWMIAMKGIIPPSASSSDSLSVRSQLQIATLQRNYYAVYRLLSKDSSVGNLLYQYPKDGNTALHYAALANDEGMLMIFEYFYWIEHGVGIEQCLIRNKEGKTFLNLLSDAILKNRYQDSSLSNDQRLERFRLLPEIIVWKKNLSVVGQATEQEEKPILTDQKQIIVKKNRKTVKGKKVSSSSSVIAITQEDVDKAHTAELELLQMLEKEEKKSNQQKQGKSSSSSKKK